MQIGLAMILYALTGFQTQKKYLMTIIYKTKRNKITIKCGQKWPHWRTRRIFDQFFYQNFQQQKFVYKMEVDYYSVLRFIPLNLEMRILRYIVIKLINCYNTKMIQEKSPQALQVYSIQVSGIKCTNCAGKITKKIEQLFSTLGRNDNKVSVNIIQQTVMVALNDDQALLPMILQALKQINFSAIKEPILISGGAQNVRRFGLIVEEACIEQVKFALLNSSGVVKAERKKQNQVEYISVEYNHELISGRQIGDIAEQEDSSYRIINTQVQSFKTEHRVAADGPSLILTAVLVIYFLLFNMFLPLTGDWYMDFALYPNQFGIFSFFTVANQLLAAWVFFNYSRHFIKKAASNYYNANQMNMETLIALGSIGGYFLFVFTVIRYVIDSHFQAKEAVMMINDSLTSSSIIVLVVTIGKFFEAKAKKKIEQMTRQIFPEQSLFSQMEVEFCSIKNRKLDKKDSKRYDATLIEKGDYIIPSEGRLLLDTIIAKGKVSAVQGTTMGSEELMQLGIGDRIESGSMIISHEDSLLQVENQFQNGILLKIGMQIRHSRNQQSSEQSGIQAVCQQIATYFVKGVILFSLATMLVWTIILLLNAADVKTCGVCWVIQRGVGVLVASCPCALGLAVPSVVAIVLNLAAKSGILIRNVSVFESMKDLKIVAFDKTGTLFTKLDDIQDFVVFEQAYTEKQTKLWEIISIVEKELRHPLAEILYKISFKRSEITGNAYNYILLQKPKVTKNGLSALIRDKEQNKEVEVFIGNRNILAENGLQVPSGIDRADKAQGGTQLFLSVDGCVSMMLVLNTHSNLRPEAVSVIQKITALGFEPHILSGDSEQSVVKLSKILNLPSEVLHPQHSSFKKMQWIQKQQKVKKGVMMIGDGLNDIPCLQQANIGISINAKSELNINVADVVMLSENLQKIVALLRLLKRGNLFITANLGWAFAYNLIMMPVVAGAFFSLGVTISPVWSSIAMSLSSIIVVLFSQLLSCFSYDDSLTETSVKKGQKLQQIELAEQSSVRSEQLDVHLIL